MGICICPFTELSDQFKLRPDRKVEFRSTEVESTEVVINLQLQLVVNYKLSKNRIIRKGMGPYEGRGKTKT